jgi:flagellar biosynthesis protein FlhA
MMANLRAFFGRYSDIALVVLVVGILAVLFAPIPPSLLDFLLLANFSFALLVLLLTFYMRRPVEFSTFPSLLLIATLFRLSLNVSATRLILSHGEAGRVIGAIGSHVVGGNYVIGLIVFLILVVVQYVVVTNGAQRVSEVAARFTLDSMPGQQMSIDADLNMGFIDQKEAMRRRRALERESAFYGAMDGASKFVKGDAIAGIIILLVDIVGGLVIGVMQMGLPWAEALHRYTLLTIGDGIVTQVPALVISVGTGIIVTRSGSDTGLSSEVFRQVSSSRKALTLVLLALVGLAFLPGLPGIPVAVLALVFGFMLWAARTAADDDAAPEASDAAAEGSSEDEDNALPQLAPIEVRAGTALSTLTSQDPAEPLVGRIHTLRKQFALDWGLQLPLVRLTRSTDLDPTAYEIWIHGVRAGKGELMPDKTLALHASGDTKTIPGIATREPTYGLPALWIDASQTEAARLAKFTLVDAETVFITHLGEMLRQQSPALLTRAEADKLLGRVRQAQPGLIEEIIPTLLTVGDIQKVLQALLREKVSIRNLEAICETLADVARQSKDPSVLAEFARQRLGPAICQSLLGESDSLQVLTIDPRIEQELSEAIRAAAGAGAHALPIDPRTAEQLVGRLAAAAEQMMKANVLPILLCPPELRRHLRTLSERAVPHMRVLSLSEVPNSIPLKSFGVVSVAAS